MPATPRDPAEIERHLAAFRRGAVDLIEDKQLAAMLAKGRPLRIKFGMDPSSPDLHVGHSIPLLKLRDLQQLGHQIVLIVGDATAMVGDPSGRNKLRPTLTASQVQQNLETYVEQAALVLDMDKTEVRHNKEWFGELDFGGLLRLCGRMTVAQMLERDMFKKRMAANEPIGIHEFLYPLLQGWDSVMVKADVEFGGTDQLFNLLAGRNFQEQEGQRPQIVLTTPLINGSDGRKMSKSYGNAIQLTDAPADMFGQVMAVTDDVMGTWFELLTRIEPAEIEQLLAGHPREAKARLGKAIVATFHDEAAAEQAAQAFTNQFAKKQLPDDIPEVSIPDLPDIFLAREQEDGPPGTNLGRLLEYALKHADLARSNSEVRRLFKDGAIKRIIQEDGVTREEVVQYYEAMRWDDLLPGDGEIYKVGKRRYVKLRRSW